MSNLFKLILLQTLILLVIAGCNASPSSEPQITIADVATMTSAPTSTREPTVEPKPTETAEPTMEPTIEPTVEVMSQEEKDEALLEALREDNVQQVQELITMGADVNQINRVNGYTPLTIAVLRDNPETFSLLVDAGADVAVIDKSENNLFHHAAYNNSLLVVEKLFAYSDIDLEHKRQRYDFTPLLVAAFRGNTEMVVLLVENGADIEAGDAWNDTPLNVAAWNGNLETVKALVELGAKLTVVNSLGDTALVHAQKQKHPETEEFLLMAGATTE